MKNCIYIFGASGAGTSTLGREIGKKYGHTWLDVDDYFWLPTDPPFTEKRERKERIRLLLPDLEKSQKCVISGCVGTWGDALIPKFDLCLWVQTPTAIRIDRLKRREFARFGNRIRPGGDLYATHMNFIEWAASYDTADNTHRSFAMHNEWKNKLLCPLLFLDGTKPVEELIREIEPALSE